MNKHDTNKTLRRQSVDNISSIRHKHGRLKRGTKRGFLVVTWLFFLRNFLLKEREEIQFAPSIRRVRYATDLKAKIHRYIKKPFLAETQLKCVSVLYNN